MDLDALLRQLRGFAKPLTKVMLAVFAGLLAFELAEEFLLPDLTKWQSHALTIVYGALLAGVVGYFALRMHAALYQQVLEENEKYRNSDEELRRNKEWFRSLTEHGSDLITVIDPKGAILYDSPSIERILGYRPVDRLGKSGFDLVHPEDIPKARSIIGRAFQHLGSTHTIEMRVRGQDGRWHVFESTGKALMDHEGKLCGVINSRDITERKRLEETLQRTQQQQQAILDNIPDIAWLKDTESKYIAANEAFAKSCGTSQEHVPGKTDFEFWPKQLAERYRADDREVMQTGKRKIVQEPFVDKDGRSTWIETIKTPVIEDNGRIVGTAGIARDITERKLIEEKLRLQTTALQAAVNGIVITDRNGSIVWANPAFTTLTGYSDGEVLGQNPRLLKSGLQDPAFYATLWNTITSGRSWHGEIVNKRKDGTLYTEEQTVTPVRDAQGMITHFIAIKRDITERKQLELQTRQLSRLAALGQLIGGIAHELKNPLFILTGRIQMAREKLANQEYTDLGSELEIIDDVGRRMTTITERFLTLAKPPPPQQERCSIQTVLHGVVQFLSNELMKNTITVATDFASDLPEIRSDPQQLHEVFLNLMLNAMQSMARAHGKGSLTVSTAREGNRIVVKIQDDGPGIAPEHRARLFDPFFSTAEQGKGTGLGLWIVRSTLMMLKSEIACESEVGKGATFIVRLPINGEHAKP